MEKLPVEHIKIKDGPVQVVTRPAGSGALIYCQSGSIDMEGADGTAYGEDTFSLTLSSRSTVAFFVSYHTISSSSDTVTVTSGLDVGVTNQDGPYAVDTVKPEGDDWHCSQSINLVITRDPGEHDYTLFTRYDGDESGQTVDYSLTAIVSTDNDQECIPTSGGG